MASVMKFPFTPSPLGHRTSNAIRKNLGHHGDVLEGASLAEVAADGARSNRYDCSFSFDSLLILVQ
jgi:hypothetical protein